MSSAPLADVISGMAVSVPLHQSRVDRVHAQDLRATGAALAALPSPWREALFPSLLPTRFVTVEATIEVTVIATSSTDSGFRVTILNTALAQRSSRSNLLTHRLTLIVRSTPVTATSARPAGERI
jgi:hypothetical protein